MICIGSTTEESQGCLCPIEESNVMMGKCLPVSLRHSPTRGGACHKDSTAHVSNKSLFEFWCQLQAAGSLPDRKCQCLKSQQFLISDLLAGSDNPFPKTVQKEELGEHAIEDLRAMLDVDVILNSSTYAGPQVVNVETFSTDIEEHTEAQASFTDAPGFYIVPRSLPMAEDLRHRRGNSSALRPVKQQEVKIPFVNRFASLANPLLGKSSQVGNFCKSLAPRTFKWVTEENRTCMEDACGEAKDRKDLEKVCLGDLSNLDKFTRHNCQMCSPLNGVMLAQHCRQLVTKEQIAVYTVCGMCMLLILLALGLVALRRWRRLRAGRGQESQKTSEKVPSADDKKPWYHFVRVSQARKVSGSDQAEKGSSPRKLTKEQTWVQEAPGSHERVPVMPPANFRDISLHGVDSTNPHKGDAVSTSALPVIPHIRISSTGSQHGAIDPATAMIRRKVSLGLD